jgi:4-hydroxybenzoyl-CoA thioesterase
MPGALARAMVGRMTFRTTIKVRFSDEDHARIVYYPRFFHFFHVAFEDFFESEGVPYRVCLDEGVGWPAVHAESDFESPVRFGDELEIAVDVERLGRTSATFRYSGSVAGRRAVRGKIVVACIDMTSYRAQEIPAKYRTIFERHVVASG